MAEVVASAPEPVEAPEECFAVYGADGTPSDKFVVCDSATSPARRRAIASRDADDARDAFESAARP